MRGLAALALVLVANPAAARVGAPNQLPDQFVAAWNAHDLKAFKALYTRDAVWVPVAHERTEGRQAIIGEFAKIHAGNGWALHSRILLKGAPEVHMLRRDVATVFFHIDYISDGKPIPGLQRALILVAVADHGDWKIAAGQLTKESTPVK